MLRRRLAALALATLTVGGGAMLVTRRQAVMPARAAADQPAADVPGSDEPVADWCAPGYEALPGGCFAQPAATSEPQPLLVYLHGRYAADAPTEEVERQRRLAARATARGFAVLALRGRQGQCTAAELATWYCWPSNEKNEGDAPAVVSRWQPVLAEATKRAHATTRYVLGFSNGAYLAGLLATRALLDADAFVVAHGGPVEPVNAARGKPPMLLLSADEDVSQDDMIRLSEELTREGWAHDAYARGGVHGLSDEDIDAALTFFSRAHEKLPLDPPLATLHRPVHHAHESVAEALPATAPTVAAEQAPTNAPAVANGQANENSPATE